MNHLIPSHAISSHLTSSHRLVLSYLILLISSHLISSHLISSHLVSSHLISFQLSSAQLIKAGKDVLMLYECRLNNKVFKHFRENIPRVIDIIVLENFNLSMWFKPIKSIYNGIEPR